MINLTKAQAAFAFGGFCCRIWWTDKSLMKPPGFEPDADILSNNQLLFFWVRFAQVKMNLSQKAKFLTWSMDGGGG